MKQLKIKTKVNVQKEIDVEINIPYFCKSENGCVFYKVLNEDGHSIIVTHYSIKTAIEFSKIFYDNLIFAEGNIRIEGSEFIVAFEKAMNILENK